MPKTATSFEYIDGRGRKHRVRSIKKVPKEYMSTLLVTGDDEEGAQTSYMIEETGADGDTGHSQDFIADGNVTPLMIIVLVFFAGLFFTKSFLGRVILGAIALMVGFFLSFSWFQTAGDAGTKTWKEFDKEMEDRRNRPGIGEYFKKEFEDLNRASTH